MPKPFPPVISICHATARPNAWHFAWRSWQSHRSSPGVHYEYILCMDARQAFQLPRFPLEYNRTIVNYGRESCNTAFNVAAGASSGHIIVIAADDSFPPMNWDRLLLDAVYRSGKSLDDGYVIWVSTGGVNDNRLMTAPILSRKRFLTKGYALWPGYPTVYADNDFTESAQIDGVVIDARKTLRFEHRHFTMHGGFPEDEVYRRQNDPKQYEEGERVFLERRAAGFPPMSWYEEEERRTESVWEEKASLETGEMRCPPRE